MVTSPPYWALRDYEVEPVIWDEGEGFCEHSWYEVDVLRKPSPGDVPSANSIISGKYKDNYDNALRPGKPSSFCSKCGAWKGNFGLEPTPELYIEHWMTIAGVAWKKLRDDGSFWVNIGDTYANSGGAGGDWQHGKRAGAAKWKQPKVNRRPKSLVGIPFMLATAMTEAGWIHRETIIWAKPNPMPSSAPDKFTPNFEYFFHFTKEPKYYFEQILEPAESKKSSPRKYGGNKQEIGGYCNPVYSGNVYDPVEYDGMRIKRNVWWISTAACKYEHFASFPEKLVEPVITSCCPRWICTRCGKPREKIVERKTMGKSWHDHSNDLVEGMSQAHGEMSQHYLHDYTRVFKGWTDCGCNAGFKPGIVWDPFCGTGTSLVVAKRLGRDGIGSEINENYAKFATQRLEQEVEATVGENVALW